MATPVEYFCYQYLVPGHPQACECFNCNYIEFYAIYPSEDRYLPPPKEFLECETQEIKEE
jgi:hypothetical protein